MDDKSAFIRAIHHTPDDDTPRLVYADWLEEHSSGSKGDPNFDQATLIRTQILLERRRHPDGKPLTAKQRGELERLEEQLQPTVRAAWEKQLHDLGVNEIESFRRGFPEVVSMTAPDFLANAEALFQRAPVTGVHITYSTPEQIEALAASPYLGNLKALNLESLGIGLREVESLAASPHLGSLTTLDLWNNDIGPYGAEALAASPHLGNLTTLNLGYNHIGPYGARDLAASAHLANLTTLNLGDNHIQDAGTRALAESPHLESLKTLELWHNNISDVGAQALSTSQHLGKLTTLDLAYNNIRDAGGQALAASEHLGNLTTLDLEGNHIGPAGARALAASEQLGKATLKLEFNNIGSYVLEEITRTLEQRRAAARGK